MTRSPVREILQSDAPEPEVLVSGWVRTKRDSKAFSFIEINDGSCLANLQVVADASLEGYEEAVIPLTTGASVSIRGKIVESQG